MAIGDFFILFSKGICPHALARRQPNLLLASNVQHAAGLRHSILLQRTGRRPTQYCPANIKNRVMVRTDKVILAVGEVHAGALMRAGCLQGYVSTGHGFSHDSIAVWAVHVAHSSVIKWGAAAGRQVEGEIDVGSARNWVATLAAATAQADCGNQGCSPQAKQLQEVLTVHI